IEAAAITSPPVQGNGHHEIRAQAAQDRRETRGHLAAQRSGEVVHVLEFQAPHQPPDGALVLRGPDDGVQGAATGAVAGRPGEAPPAGKADPALLAPWQRPGTQAALGGKDRREKRLEEAPCGTNGLHQPDLSAERGPRGPGAPTAGTGPPSLQAPAAP